MQIIENKEIKIMFDEDNAIKNLMRYEESHQAEKKRAKIHNKKFTRKLIIFAIVCFTIVFGSAYYIWEKFKGASIGEAFPVTMMWGIFFVATMIFLIYLMANGYKNVKDIEHSYDNNLWFYLMQKDKNVIDIKITDCEGGKYCELSLITLAPENYVITELYQKNLDNRIVNHDCHILLRKVLKKDIDKITVDIPKGEVQYPYTEPLERLVVSNG